MDELVMQSIRKKLYELSEKENTYEKKELELAQLKKQIDDIKNKYFPELFDMCEVSSLTLQNVKLFDKVEEEMKLRCKSTLFASIVQRDKEKRRAAYTWLVDQGYGEIIQHSITIPVNEEKKEALYAYLHVNNIEYEDVQKVHASTLSATMRRLLDQTCLIPEGINTFEKRSLHLS